MSAIWLAEKRWLPDWMIRVGIRRMLLRRIQMESRKLAAERERAMQRFIRMLQDSPVAIETAAANEQHYEVPGDFFQSTLGPHLKYSCGYWKHLEEPSAESPVAYSPGSKLAESERHMLELTAERADIVDGMRILDLGCGWGSFSLFAAERFPNSHVVGVSNSHGQREWIMRQAAERGIENLEIRTANVATLGLHETFDRIVSIEMFEHMRNYRELLRRIASWLSPEGRLFVHIFCHRELAYAFNVGERGDWMARHFFTGGLMPSENLFANFQDDLRLEEKWVVNGRHYAKTCESWLTRMDANIDSIEQLFVQAIGQPAAAVQIQRWRMFFMACAELFAFDEGNQWYVAHYRFAK